MGRRGRARALSEAATQPTPPGAKSTTKTDARPAKTDARPAVTPPGRARLDPVRRTLTAYLAAALVLAILTLAGIVVLGGTLGPFVTLALAVVGAGLVHRTATARLAHERLTDEDRMIQTMAGGLLVLCVVLSAAGAVVATLA